MVFSYSTEARRPTNANCAIWPVLVVLISIECYQKFNVALLMYMAHNRLCPLYISEVLAPSVALPRTGNYVLPAAATTQYQELELNSVNVYNDSAPGNQHFRELLPTANDVINIYMTSNSTGNVGLSCD